MLVTHHVISRFGLAWTFPAWDKSGFGRKRHVRFQVKHQRQWPRVERPELAALDPKQTSVRDELPVENPHDEVILPCVPYESCFTLAAFLDKPTLAVACDCASIAR